MQRPNFLLFVARGDFLRLLQRLLRFDRHFVESQHQFLISLQHFLTPILLLKKRSWHFRQPLSCLTGLLPYRAAAAAAGVPTFTLICFGFASSRFGIVSVKTPS